MIKRSDIDGGQGFDFGRTAADYAKYRDIYPSSFYETLRRFEIGLPGQHILDLGTGSGVIPRHMIQYGAKWTGADLSPEQIKMAKRLTTAHDLDIDYLVCPADNVPVPDHIFDVVTACQCFWYFPLETTVPEIKRILKPGGTLAVISMIGLPRESEILAKSEQLVLKFNPLWNGGDFARVKLSPPDWLGEDFSVVALHETVEDVPFTRENWRGRMRACRGVGAALPPPLIAQYDQEHDAALRAMADETFCIPHQFLFQIFKANAGL